MHIFLFHYPISLLWHGKHFRAITCLAYPRHRVDVASFVGVSRDAISKYERDDIIPSVENANKIAKVLGVSLDYLMSEDDNLEVVDIDMLNRMKEIQRLSEDDKNTVTKIIDAFIRDTKTKKAYA